MSIYPPTGTLEIKNATLKIPVVDLQYTSNTAKLEANSNVVTEFSRSKKLIKYPRVALTSAAQTNSGYESYFVSQASATLHGTSDRQAWAFFDTQGPGQGNSLASPHLVSSADRFDTSGNYTGGDSLAGVSGDWIYIRLPDKIQLQSVNLWARYDSQRNPIDGTVLGSLNGTNWSVIGSWKNANFTAGNSTSFTINSVQHYDYIGFVFEKIEANSSGKYVNFHEIDLYGVPEYDPEADGTDVTLKSLPNVPNTDWLEVYYEGKNYTSGVVQDETGNNRNGTLDGVTYDSVSESFTFVSGNKITAGPMTSFPSGTHYTASMWFKVSEIITSQKLLFHFGHGDTGESFGLNIQNGNIGLFLWGVQTNFTADNLYTANEWVHAVGTINGSTAEVYVNGHLRISSAQNSTTTIPTNPYLSLGIHFNGEQSSFFTSGFFTGSIANFRIFNRALTSDEAWQLYASQKEYFGHGDLSMTLKAGRLGIGTSEPRAMLDVRGDIYGGCPVLFKANIETPGNTTLSSSESTPVIWNRVSWNKGGGYDSSNGKFTAPIDGYYSFNHWAMSQGNDNIIFKYMVNGAASNDLNPIRNEPYQTPTGNHTQNSGTTTFKLRSGDYVELFLSGGSMFVSATGSAMYNSYEGYYLSSW